ncbi:uncharacterized protein LOC128553575 [Mercenaria mercenaria]|uniref:uncharacterized protein LOC128553575 n=1 Tax=Mercenaria mercenaria TaxID=6596 RepID=UPI00234EE056|nr:uncharacterized protein LOC128553575 [Mercenaria mercenaria]
MVISETLECYNCSITSGDVNDCFNTTQCQNGQSCYMNLKQKGNSPQYTLGCINNQICGSPSSAVGELIGRDLIDRQTQDCHECCSTDNCNKHLCEHLKPSSCIDDAKADCPWLNSIFNICQDIHNAKSVCPKFCGLCSLGRCIFESISNL